MPLGEMGAKTNDESRELVRLLDSTTISLFAKTYKMLRYRSDNSAIKLHLMLDDVGKCPTWFQITPARFYNSKVCDDLPLTAGTTFDRAYNFAAVWAEIEAAGAVFVIRPKSSLAYDVTASAYHPDTTIVADETITLAGIPGAKYPKPLCRVEIFNRG